MQNASAQQSACCRAARKTLALQMGLMPGQFLSTNPYQGKRMRVEDERQCGKALPAAAERNYPATLAAYAVAVIAGFVTMTSAFALQPSSDVYVHLDNATGEMLSVCDADGTRCKPLAPGATAMNGYATGRPNVAFIGQWIPSYAVRVCGRVMPLQTLITEPAISEDWNSLTFHLTMSRKNYERECGQMEPKRAARR
ncbi:hypothetical protein [Massilia aquatica]|uniref:Uncharacterized protein n=1 Tax=Massilia aquatica TaxID=2609000 RepID=A0ABX0MCQ3_9BURK|nr:hypothetical protein [Massilia aquatica]NHZ42745.1 hypothetical protein [Massilia aquatica]